MQMSEQTQERGKKLTKSELRPRFARDANIGLTHLWNLGHQALSIHPGLAGYYMSQFQKRSLLANTTVHEKIKTNYCQACGSIFVPGATCSAQLKRKIFPESEKEINLKTRIFKPRIYRFRSKDNNDKTNPLSKHLISGTTARKTNNLKITCSLCKAITLLPVPKKPKIKSVTCAPMQNISSDIKPANSAAGSNCKEALKIMNLPPGLPIQNTAFKKRIDGKDAAKINKNSKQIAQPKATIKKKTSKALNLAKMLENDKKAKEEAKTASQGFSLGDFLKKFN